MTTYTVSIPVVSYYQVEVTRPENTDAYDIAMSITKEELSQGEGAMTWEDITEAFDNADFDSNLDVWNVTDENGETIN